MGGLLLRYWRVVLAAVCAVFVVVAATVAAAEFGRPGNETHAQLPPTRQLADLSDTELAGFLPNAADLPMGWRAQQDAAHPGLSEISGTASQPGCSQRPDQVAVSTAAVSATLRGPLLEADTFPAEVTIALLRDPESVNLHVRTQSWVAQCAQVTMHYRGTGICQADLNTKVLPNLSVGTVVVGRFKIVSTNKHCLHGDSYPEPNSIAGITMARVSDLTVVIHSDGLSDLAEPIVRTTLQRLAAFPATPSLPRDALASNGPAFLALLPTLAQTPPNGRWFVDQRSGEQQRNLAPAQPITTSPAGCEPLPFPDTDLMIEGPKRYPRSAVYTSCVMAPALQEANSVATLKQASIVTPQGSICSRLPEPGPDAASSTKSPTATPAIRCPPFISRRCPPTSTGPMTLSRSSDAPKTGAAVPRTEHTRSPCCKCGA